ncbi:LysR family transcriptional regulator [Novosphingobium sp. KN65.2]|uniref:LysR family transcriptional regulator n=1 Tax=Novosphingobium sp. KN65.2 TaxID=1478134 RepID=UPI001E60ABCD|nr:LysR family transcriptional regulator [Novosphingobium sp. KN65.2]
MARAVGGHPIACCRFGFSLPDSSWQRFKTARTTIWSSRPSGKRINGAKIESIEEPRNVLRSKIRIACAPLGDTLPSAAESAIDLKCADRDDKRQRREVFQMTITSLSSHLSAGLDPRALIVFEQVCISGSISSAARELGVSQPSVSQTISSLEGRLGVGLFNRQSTGISLTREGEALRTKAAALSGLLRDARAVVEHAAKGIAGPIQIGGTPGALVSLVPRAIRALDRMHGAFEISVIEASEQVLSEMLRRREIELALVTTGISGPGDEFREWTLAQDPFSLIVGRGHEDLPNSIGMAAASDLAWVLPREGGGFRRQISSLFINAEVAEPRNVIRCDSLLTTKSIVRATDRVTILPRNVVEAELSVGVLRAIELREVTFQRHIGIRALANVPLTPLASLFTQVLGGEV